MARTGRPRCTAMIVTMAAPSRGSATGERRLTGANKPVEQAVAILRSQPGCRRQRRVDPCLPAAHL